MAAMRYDTTLKTLFQAPPQQLLHMLVGSQASSLLTVEYPSVRMRRPDLVVRLTDGRLHHLELQSDNEAPMPWRMLEYYSLLYQTYGQPPVQHVLYVGAAPMTLVTEIYHATLLYTYTALDIRTLDSQPLLESPVLEDNLLALLCQGGSTRTAVQHILARIAPLTETARSDALTALLILAGLRHVQPLIREEAQHMALTLDRQHNAFLQEIFEEGREAGREAGREEGRQVGESTLLRRLLESRFGPLPPWAAQQLSTADTAALERWGLQLLTAGSLEEALRA